MISYMQLQFTTQDTHKIAEWLNSLPGQCLQSGYTSEGCLLSSIRAALSASMEFALHPTQPTP